MDELSAALSSVMNDPESMRQLRELASGLGLPVNTPTPPPQPAATAAPDLSALASLLSGALGQSQTLQQPPPPQNPPPDLSALASLLGGAANQQQNAAAPNLSALAGILSGAMNQAQSHPQPQQSSFDISALTSMLGGPPRDSGSSASSPINLDMIMKLQQAMSSMQTNKQNIDFLLSLKPRLNGARAKKIDDAIRVMQLIQFLPLIKESGLFTGLDSLLGGLTGSAGTGGLGNLLSGAGGLGGILNSLLGGK